MNCRRSVALDQIYPIPDISVQALDRPEPLSDEGISGGLMRMRIVLIWRPMRSGCGLRGAIAQSV